jgi:type III secretory pathway lipoprotein EscJ
MGKLVINQLQFFSFNEDILIYNMHNQNQFQSVLIKYFLTEGVKVGVCVVQIEEFLLLSVETLQWRNMSYVKTYLLACKEEVLEQIQAVGLKDI